MHSINERRSLISVVFIPCTVIVNYFKLVKTVLVNLFYNKNSEQSKVVAESTAEIFKVNNGQDYENHKLKPFAADVNDYDSVVINCRKQICT